MGENLAKPFAQALPETITAMFGQPTTTTVQLGPASHELAAEQGVASIVGFTGALRGRSLLWVPSGLACQLAAWLTGERPTDFRDEMVLFTVSELNNVISGQAITTINNAYEQDLRLSPPSILAGDDISLTTPKLATFETVVRVAQAGELRLNVALEGVLPNG